MDACEAREKLWAESAVRCRWPMSVNSGCQRTYLEEAGAGARGVHLVVGCLCLLAALALGRQTACVLIDTDIITWRWLVRQLGYFGRPRKKRLTEFDWARVCACMSATSCAAIMVNPNAWGTVYHELLYRYLRLVTISFACFMILMLADHFSIAWSLISAPTLSRDLEVVAVHARRLSHVVMWWLVIFNGIYNPLVLGLYRGPSGTIPGHIMFPAQLVFLILFSAKTAHACYRCRGIIAYLKSAERSVAALDQARSLKASSAAKVLSRRVSVGTVSSDPSGSVRVVVVQSPARTDRLRKTLRKTTVALISFVVLAFFGGYRIVLLSVRLHEGRLYWLPTPCGVRSIFRGLQYPILMLVSFAFMIMAGPSRREESAAMSSRASGSSRMPQVRPEQSSEGKDDTAPCDAKQNKKLSSVSHDARKADKARRAHKVALLPTVEDNAPVSESSPLRSEVLRSEVLSEVPTVSTLLPPIRSHRAGQRRVPWEEE